MNNLKKSIMSVAMAAITAASPILSSYAAYASDITVNDDGTVTQISTSTEGSTSKADETKFLFIKIKTVGGKVVLNEGEDQEQRIRLDKKTDGVEYIDVYDKNNVLISSESTKDNDYTYVYEAKADDAVNVKAKADEGYKVKLYELTDDSSGTEIAEDVGFDAGNKVDSFKYPVFMEYDKTVKIGFEKTESADDIAKDLSVNDDAGKDKADEQGKTGTEAEGDEKEKVNAKNEDTTDISEDLTVDSSDDNDSVLSSEENETEAALDDSDSYAEDNGNEDTDDVSDVDDANDAKSANNDIESGNIAVDNNSGENVSESVDDETFDESQMTDDEKMGEDALQPNIDKQESIGNNANDIIVNTEPDIKNEHFTNTEELSSDISGLDFEKFKTARLIVMTNDKNDIIDSEHMIASYGDIYLLQYNTVEQAMTAYLYYNGRVSAVEPDATLDAAGEDVEMKSEELDEEVTDNTSETEGTQPTEIAGMTVDNVVNPVSALADTVASEKAVYHNQVIALIDTGVGKSNNVIDRVSLIDDVMVGGTHGIEMERDIVEQNPDAKILSIRALGNDGYGSISSVIAGIEYAINSKVNIINLSMYSRKTSGTGVLEAEIQKAIDNGIVVVDSAGNDDADVAEYVPGSIDSVWTIGAATESGTKQTISNYGDSVDYYVVADSTSKAAAKFTGYISKYGLEAASVDSTGMIYSKLTDGYNNGKIDVKDDTANTDKTDMIYDPIIENYVRENMNPEYVGEGKLQLTNYIDVDATIASEDQLKPGETIDSLMKNDTGFRFITQNTGRVPVYQLNEDSEYVVAFADVMHNDNKARIVDSVVARNDVTGTAINGCKFDEATGLLYIPRTAFVIDNTCYIGCIQMQILYAISNFSITNQWNSATNVVTENTDGSTDADIEGYNILLGVMSVQVGKYMDVNKMLVSVNGIPIEGKSYSYDSANGVLTVGFSSSVVQSIWVQAEKSDDAPEVEPGLKAADNSAANLNGGANFSGSAVSFDNMKAVDATALKVNFDKLQVGSHWLTTATLLYPDRPENSSGIVPGYNNVIAYAGPGYGEQDAKFAYYIFGNYSNNTFFADKKVWNLNSGDFIPFAIPLYTIDDAPCDFSKLPKNLRLAMQCTHADVPGFPDRNVTDGNEVTGRVALRCVALDKNATKPWAVFAMYTSRCFTQHGMGLFKVYLTPEGGSLVITKKIRGVEMAASSERIKLNTEFTIFKNEACTKKWKGNEDAPNGVIVFKEGEKVAKAVKTISNMDPGIYWMKETGKCTGTIHNLKKYKFTITKGKSTKVLVDLETGKEVNVIENIPFIGKFKIVKEDEDSKDKLAGAIFRVKYYGKDRLNENEKAERTWYFQTDENGEILYDNKHYLSSWTHSTTKKVYKSDAPITIENGEWWLPFSNLYITEVKAPKGYSRNHQEFHLEIKADRTTQMKDGYWVNQKCPTATVTVTDKKKTENKWYARVQIKKVNKNLEGLGDAVFKVYMDKDCTIPATKSEQEKDTIVLTSKNNGLSNIEKIELSAEEDTVTLYCVEDKAPNGYSTTDEIFSLTFSKKDYDALSTEEKKNGELKLFGPKDGVINDEGWKVRVDAKKVDEDGNPLKDAILGVYNKGECNDDSKIGELKSINDGSTNILDYSAPMAQDEITLYCQEIKAPSGYTKSNRIYTVTFKKSDYDKLSEDKKKDGELQTFGIDKEKGENGIVNTKGWQVRVNAKKVDGNGKALQGATFEVFSSADMDKESYIGLLTSGVDGMTDILTAGFSDDVPEARLYCKEKSAPEGYVASKDMYELVFTKDKYDELKKADKNTEGELQTFGPQDGIPNPSVTVSPTPKITNPPPSGSGVCVKKTSTASDDIMDLESYTLANAEFSVTSNRGFSGTLKTDESGNSNVLSLPDNHKETWIPPVYDKDNNLISGGYTRIDPVTTTYYITETKAPHWHKKNYETKSITVTMPNQKDTLFTVDFEDQPLFCENEFDIEKLGVKGEQIGPIGGAVFKVEYYDADDGKDDGAGANLVNDVSGKLTRTWYLKSDTDGHVKMDAGYLDANNRSDAFFMHDGKVVIPIGGYIKITEIDAPAEYVVDDTPVCILCNQKTDFDLTYRNSRAWYNEYQRCRVNLKKYEADGITPIAGVEFEIKFLKQAITPTSKMHPNFVRLLKEGESTVRHTDANGEVFFDNLDQGTYQITELKTKDGNALLKEPIIVTLPMTMTTDEANEYGNVDFSSAKEDKNYSGKWYFYECLYEITNNATFKMPMTGDNGKWKYGFIGFGVIMVTGIGWIIYGTKTKRIRKRKHKK